MTVPIPTLRARAERYLSAMAPGMRITSGALARVLNCPQSSASGVLRHLADKGVLVDDGSANISVGGVGVHGKLRLYRIAERAA